MESDIFIYVYKYLVILDFMNSIFNNNIITSVFSIEMIN